MIGAQKPRIMIEPHRCSSDGDDAALLMKEYGNTLDPWQKATVHCWLGRDEGDAYNITSAGLAVPRQNGKNVCIEAREFFGLVINGERIIHTAHQVRTAKKAFMRLEAMFTNQKHPEVMELVKNIRYTNGEEAIELWNGGKIEFSARSRQAGRGFDGISLIVFDEAQELTDDQLEAIMAVLAASATGTRQIIYAGTPPYPGCPGTVFRRRRTICLGNPGKHDSWHEWSVEGESIDDIDVEDKSLWYATNPSLGIWLTEEFTEEELRSMSRDGFARERLGWWSPVLTEASDKAIDAKAWDACMSSTEKPNGKTAYGVKFSPDGTQVSLAGAVIDKDGICRISLIRHESTSVGIRWLSDWLNERYKVASCVVIDGKNGVDILCDRISGVWKAKISIIRPTSKDVVAAAGMIQTEISERTLTWYHLQDDLNDSATTSIRRAIGGGWGFGGDNSTPIEAAALALWGVRTTKRDPTRVGRIG